MLNALTGVLLVRTLTVLLAGQMGQAMMVCSGATGNHANPVIGESLGLRPTVLLSYGAPRSAMPIQSDRELAVASTSLMSVSPFFSSAQPVLAKLHILEAIAVSAMGGLYGP